MRTITTLLCALLLAPVAALAEADLKAACIEGNAAACGLVDSAELNEQEMLAVMAVMRRAQIEQERAVWERFCARFKAKNESLAKLNRLHDVESYMRAQGCMPEQIEETFAQLHAEVDAFPTRTSPE